MRKWTWLAIVVLLLPVKAFCSSDEAYAAKQITVPITIDGRLDEPAWQDARIGNAFQWPTSLAKKTPPEAATDLSILADAQAVYIGIHCAEPEMAKIKSISVQRDRDWMDDMVEVFLDVTGRGVEFYHFGLNTANVQNNEYRIEGGNTQGGHYSGLWSSAVHKGSNFWSAEMRFPLSAFSLTDSKDFRDAWLVNASRTRNPKPEGTSWAPVKRRFLESASFIRVSGMPLKPARMGLQLTDCRADVTALTSNAVTGTLLFKTQAWSPAAGKLVLALDDESGKPLITPQTVTIASGQGVIELKDITFPALGKMLVRASLSTLQGEIMTGGYFPLQLEYRPLSISVTQPFYAQCIFPGQDVKKISGKVAVNMPASARQNMELAVVLISADGTTNRQVFHSRGESVDFEWPATDLPVGEYKVKTALTTAGRSVAEIDTLIRKLAEPSGNCVYIDTNLNLVVNGKPLFVRGWYGNEGYRVSRQLLRDSPHPDSRFVNTWHYEMGMEAERLDSTEVGRVKQDVEPSAKVFDEMRRRIENSRTNRNVWVYYLADEPECRVLSPIYLKHQYDFIKCHDPYHPVMIVTRAPDKYTACADILNPHPYLTPCMDEKGRRWLSRSMGYFRQKIRTVYSAGQRRIPAWVTPEAFSYGYINSEADNPTFDEFNCMAFTAVAGGVKGVTPYIYNNHFDSMDLRLGCDYVYETIAALEDFLLGAPESLPVKHTAAEDDLEICLRQMGDQYLMIAVNMTDKPLKAGVEAPALQRLDKLHGFRQSSDLTLRDGKGTLDFMPYQVQLFTFPRRGENLKTVEAVRKEIAQANAALRKPGNLLYGRRHSIEWDQFSTGYGRLLYPYSLTDGICDAYGFFGGTPAWITASFLDFVPKFKTVKFYTATIEDLDLSIWKDGEWRKTGEARGNQNDVITITLPEPVTTVKIKVEIIKAHSGMKAELYEIEMYE